MTRMHQASQIDLHLSLASIHLVLLWSRSTKAQLSSATQSLRTIKTKKTLRIQTTRISTNKLFHKKW
jgi:hypothetical protein